MSRITALRTIRIAERANLIWVEIETEDGLTGLGESFHGALAVEAVLHEQVAPWLIGRDAGRARRTRRASPCGTSPASGAAGALLRSRATSAEIAEMIAG